MQESLQSLWPPSGIELLVLTVSVWHGKNSQGWDRMGKWYLGPSPQGSPGPSWAPHGSLVAEIQLKPPPGEEESSHLTAYPRMGV